MSPSQNYVIKTQGLTKSFREVQALQSVNLQVPQHSIFGFLGPNGAGKTTLMKILLGLSRPTSGSGTIFGHDILSESVAIRERIGYLPQQPRFIDYMTARENLEFAARFFLNLCPNLFNEFRQHLELFRERIRCDKGHQRAVCGHIGKDAVQALKSVHRSLN